jgi:hypothetical protein
MAVFKFEQKGTAMLTSVQFAGRWAGNIVLALIIIGFALAAGMVGYHLTENMDWLDAFLNAAMLLGGMGPVDQLHTAAGKLFAGVYALACGLLFVLVSGVVLAPVLHRVLHALHVSDDDDDKPSS